MKSFVIFLTFDPANWKQKGDWVFFVIIHKCDSDLNLILAIRQRPIILTVSTINDVILYSNRLSHMFNGEKRHSSYTRHCLSEIYLSVQACMSDVVRLSTLQTRIKFVTYSKSNRWQWTIDNELCLVGSCSWLQSMFVLSLSWLIEKDWWSVENDLFPSSVRPISFCTSATQWNRSSYVYWLKLNFFLHRPPQKKQYDWLIL